MNNNSLFQGYQVGQTAFFEKKILEEHIIQFATVTEDNNRFIWMRSLQKSLSLKLEFLMGC